MIGADRAIKRDRTEPETPCLAMKPRKAAKALDISERLLWEWTDRGVVPRVGMGKAILYPVGVLHDWLQQQAASAPTDDPERI